MTANQRRARLVIAVGALLLALGAGLTLWDASEGDTPPDPVITGTERGAVVSPADG